MSPPTDSAEYVRRGLLKINPVTILGVVDSLDLRSSNKVSPIIGVPLRNLQQRRDLSSFVLSAPIAAAKALLELLAAAPLEQVITALGDHAESPTYDQLRDAIDTMVAGGVGDDEIVALLTFAIGEEFPASIHCRQLLAEREALALPPLPAPTVTSSLLAPKEINAHVREQRRARREERAKRSKPPSSGRPPTKRAKRSASAAAPTLSPPRSLAPVAAERRRLLLTPSEVAAFDGEHPLVGTVLLVEIPFDAVDPARAEVRSKERPALVVAASDRQILVRGLYSNPAVTRVLFSAWRRLGLDHVSYIDDVRSTVAIESVDRIEVLGRLTDDEWNSLF